MTWEVGDLALCVELGSWFDRDERCFVDLGPAVGSVHTVEYLGASHGQAWLGFPEWPQDEFTADAFRKILPDKHEACETEFVDLLKRSKRTVKA